MSTGLLSIGCAAGLSIVVRVSGDGPSAPSRVGRDSRCACEASRCRGSFAPWAANIAVTIRRTAPSGPSHWAIWAKGGGATRWAHHASVITQCSAAAVIEPSADRISGSSISMYRLLPVVGSSRVVTTGSAGTRSSIRNSARTRMMQPPQSRSVSPAAWDPMPWTKITPTCRTLSVAPQSRTMPGSRVRNRRAVSSTSPVASTVGSIVGSPVGVAVGGWGTWPRVGTVPAGSGMGALSGSAASAAVSTVGVSATDAGASASSLDDSPDRRTGQAERPVLPGGVMVCSGG